MGDGVENAPWRASVVDAVSQVQGSQFFAGNPGYLTPGGGAWRLERFDFSLPNAGACAIGFLPQASSAGYTDVLLDNVSLTAIPEPGALAFPGAASAGLMMRRRAR